MTTHLKRTNPGHPGDYIGYTVGQPITGPDSNGDIVQHHGDPALLALDGWMPIVSKPYNPDTHKLTDQRTDDGNEAWRVTVALTQDELAERMTEQTSELVSATKAEARRRILAIIPEWKQANATARAVEIVNSRLSGTATPEELAELSQLAGVLGVVKAIRTASDLIEADISAGMVKTTEEIENSARWPL